MNLTRSKILSGEKFSDEDRYIGCMIAESAILNLRGHIDSVSTFPKFYRAITNVCVVVYSTLYSTCPTSIKRYRKHRNRVEVV
jgi:hypothetical protein